MFDNKPDSVSEATKFVNALTQQEISPTDEEQSDVNKNNDEETGAIESNVSGKFFLNFCPHKS